MSDTSGTRRAFETAEKAVAHDASRLVEAVPGLMREAARQRDARNPAGATVGSLAAWALPRLAAATAVAAGVAGWVVVDQNRQAQPADPATFESVILGGENGSTGDVVFDALLGAGRSDG